MQIHRLLEIVYTLLEKERVTAAELARNFGVSERTVYRDVDALSAAGIPVYMSKGYKGGISLLPGYAVEKSMLSDAEKTEILSALTALGAVRPDAQTAALGKLSSLFSSSSADWVEVDFSPWSGSGGDRDKFEALKTAILERKKISFFYYSTGGGELRVVCPLKLCFRGQSWYLYGFCVNRRENRFFKLRRMKDLNVSDERHTLTAPAKVSERSAPAAAAKKNAKIIISAKMAYRVYDEFNSCGRDENGDFIITVDYDRTEWLFPRLLTYGSECRIIEPASLRAEMKNFLEKVLKNYD